MIRYYIDEQCICICYKVSLSYPIRFLDLINMSKGYFNPIIWHIDVQCISTCFNYFLQFNKRSFDMIIYYIDEQCICICYKVYLSYPIRFLDLINMSKGYFNPIIWHIDVQCISMYFKSFRQSISGILILDITLINNAFPPLKMSFQHVQIGFLI